MLSYLIDNLMVGNDPVLIRMNTLNNACKLPVALFKLLSRQLIFRIS